MDNGTIKIHEGNYNQNYGCITLSNNDSNIYNDIITSANFISANGICGCVSHNNDLVDKVFSLNEEVSLLKEELNRYKKINANLSTSLYTLIGKLQKENIINNERN